MKAFKSLLKYAVLTKALMMPRTTDGSMAGGAALNALKSIDYRYFVAGGTCAAFSHGITCPIDVIKVGFLLLSSLFLLLVVLPSVT